MIKITKILFLQIFGLAAFIKKKVFLLDFCQKECLCCFIISSTSLWRNHFNHIFGHTIDLISIKNDYFDLYIRSVNDSTKAKEKYRGIFEIQKSGDKTSSGEIGLDIRTHASPKVGQDQVSGGVSVPCQHATPVADALWKPIFSNVKFSKSNQGKGHELVVYCMIECQWSQQ